MAAAAGAALLRSVATKMGMNIAPRDPSLHAGLLGSRNLSSSSSAPSGATPPPPINNKAPAPRLTIFSFHPTYHAHECTRTNVPSELNRAKVAKLLSLTKMSCVVMFGTATSLFFWVKPRLEALNDEVNALRRERSILIEAVEECQRAHNKTQDALADSSQS